VVLGVAYTMLSSPEEFVSTFGVIVGNRGFFPDVLARDGRERSCVCSASGSQDLLPDAGGK